MQIKANQDQSKHITTQLLHTCRTSSSPSCSDARMISCLLGLWAVSTRRTAVGPPSWLYFKYIGKIKRTVVENILKYIRWILYTQTPHSKANGQLQHLPSSHFGMGVILRQVSPVSPASAPRQPRVSSVSAPCQPCPQSLELCQDHPLHRDLP